MFKNDIWYCFQSSLVYYRLVVIPCPEKTLTRLKHLLFQFLWKGQVLLVRKSIYCQHPHSGGLGIPSLMMQHHALRLSHLQKYLDHYNDVDDDNNENKGELVWASFVWHIVPHFIALTELQSWVMCRPRLGVWQLEHFQALTALYQLPKTISKKTTQIFYRGLVKGMGDDSLWLNLGIDENTQSSLLQRNFRLKTKDNFQKSLVWHCYGMALLSELLNYWGFYLCILFII